MAIGDQDDIVARLKSVIPKGWFPDVEPVSDAIFYGFAYALSFIYSLIAYAKLQTRIKTAVDGFLDLVSFDYFGTTLLRITGELDSAFRARIIFNLLRQKATRFGIINILTEITGFVPWVFEPWRPLDTGAYNTNIWGYGAAGGYGSLRVPYQAFIQAYRPIGQGIANIAGYTNPEGAYSTPSQTEWGNPSLIIGATTDADIYSVIADTKVEGTIAWTQITNKPTSAGMLLLETGGGGFELETGTGTLGLE